VLNFLRVDWKSKHIAIGLFEAIDNFGQSLVKILIELFNKYELRKKIIAYVKDGGFNLNVMITILKSIISCDILV
jgi:hypothetical protein